MTRSLTVGALTFICFGCVSQPHPESAQSRQPHTESAHSVTTQSRLEFRPASFEPSESAAVSSIPPGTERPIYVSPDAIISGLDIVEASKSEDELGRPALSIKLSDQAGDRLHNYTRQHIGEPLVIVFNDELISAPIIQASHRNHAMVTGEFTEAQLDSMIKALTIEWTAR